MMENQTLKRKQHEMDTVQTSWFPGFLVAGSRCLICSKGIEQNKSRVGGLELRR